MNFVLVPSSVFFVSSMAEDREGTIWLADSWRSVIPVKGSRHTPTIRLQGRAKLLADTHDNLWIAEDFFGLTRLPGRAPVDIQAVRVEHVNSMPGLTSPQIGDMLEDRDGNVWIGTALGLDRYRSASFKEFRAATINYYPSVASTRDGSVWINSHGEPLMQWKAGKVTTFGQFVTYGPLTTRRNGDVCFIDARASELQCYGQKNATYILLDKRIEYAPALSLMEDNDGTLLVSFENKGVWRFDGKWSRVISPAVASSSPLSMRLDSAGRVWMGYQGKLIAVRDGVGFDILSMVPGRWDNTLAMAEGSGTIWIAGSSGLAFWNGSRLQRVDSAEANIFKGTSGIVFDRLGDLWLNSGVGALRVSASSVNRILHEQHYKTPVDEYNERDGLIGSPTQNKPTPSLIADAQGTLWFATAGHLTSLDPRAVSEDQQLFSVLIESFVLDGRFLLPSSLHSERFQALPADRHSLQVSFAALDLSEPDRMRYRYRLVGEDASWQEAGTRREAIYTRLRPGKYTFLLSASRKEGGWISSQSPLQIELLPAYYQTTWFAAAVVLICCLLILGVVHLRVRLVGMSIRRVSDARADERIRIARDLHDTLLQGFQGLTLRFGAAAKQVPSGSKAQESLELALVVADRLMLEARNRVGRLRVQRLTWEDLTIGFTTIVSELGFDGRVSYDLDLEDGLPTIDPGVLTEIFYIGQEALTNACRHSKASNVSIMLKRTPKAVVLRVKDNGCGFDVASSQMASHSGHWGVAGMRERAETIGAQFECVSSNEVGTEVTVVVAAGSAYRSGDGAGLACR